MTSRTNDTRAHLFLCFVGIGITEDGRVRDPDLGPGHPKRSGGGPEAGTGTGKGTRDGTGKEEVVPGRGTEREATGGTAPIGTETVTGNGILQLRYLDPLGTTIFMKIAVIPARRRE